MRVSDDQREAVEQRLNEIAERMNQRPTPAAVVDDAQDPTSPLHGYFEWDDQAAAYKARLQVARQLIRSVRIKVQRGGAAVIAPAYVRDPERASDEEGYIHLPVVASHKALKVEVMTNELTRAIGCLQRAVSIGKVLKMDTAMVDDACDTVEQFLAAL